MADPNRMDSRQVQSEIDQLMKAGFDADEAVQVARRKAYTLDLEAFWQVLLDSFVYKLTEYPVAHPQTIEYGNQVEGIKLYDGREVSMRMVLTVPAAEPIAQSKRNLR